ncbi:MAG: hypothetical protein OEW75_06965, partial [Cyclobacteriaceae bacterium]|nr:hypothetical protein [Cyclobacteriaceae bacterium]
MNFVYNFLVILFILLNVHEGISQVTVPKYSNEFLQIGTGARGLALGGAMTSSVHSEEAGYWNPAFLTDLKERQTLSFMHSEYFGGVAAFDFLSYSLPIDSVSGLSFTLLRMGIDDIPDTRLLYDAGGVINYDNITFFSASDLAFIFSYGRKLATAAGLDLDVGGNVKIIHRKAGKFAKAWGFGIDLAARTTIKQWNIGLMLRDASSTFNAWSHSTDLINDVYSTTGNTLPQNAVELTLPSLSVGISRTILKKEKMDVTLMGDLRFTFDGKRNTLLSSDFASIDPVFGVEYGIQQLIYFRLGISKWQFA